MTFLAIVLALLVHKWHGALPRLQRDDWYRDWTQRLAATGSWIARGPQRLVVAIGLPVLGLWLALHWFGGGLLGLVALALNLLTLCYAFGRGDLRQQLAKLGEDLDRHDLQAAYHDAAAFNPQQREPVADDQRSLNEEIVEHLSYRYLERHFAVIFWFVVAGAPGALLYRLAAIERTLPLADDDARRSARWLRWLEWLPVRLLGLTLALVGNFHSCLAKWLDLLFGAQTSGELLREYVLAALAPQPVVETLDGDGVKQIDALFFRALVCWLAVIALAVIFS